MRRDGNATTPSAGGVDGAKVNRAKLIARRMDLKAGNFYRDLWRIGRRASARNCAESLIHFSKTGSIARYVLALRQLQGDGELNPADLGIL
jgi:hypothetical protein